MLALAGAAYVGGVMWLAKRERQQSDVRVKKLAGFALASFGVEAAVKGWPGETAGLAERLGAADRKGLEDRLRGLRGKAFTCAVPTGPQWERIKADPRASRLPVPPESRVVDFADPATCVTLQALHGAEHFLWVVAGYAVEGGDQPAAAVRLEAVVFGKDGRPVWMNVFTESEMPAAPAEPGAVSRDPAVLEEAMKKASARAIERLAAALEGQ